MQPTVLKELEAFGNLTTKLVASMCNGLLHPARVIGRVLFAAPGKRSPIWDNALAQTAKVPSCIVTRKGETCVSCIYLCDSGIVLTSKPHADGNHVLLKCRGSDGCGKSRRFRHLEHDP